MGKIGNRIRKISRTRQGLPIASSDGLQDFDTLHMMDSTP